MAKQDRSAVEKYHDRVAGIYDTIYDGNPYWEMVFEITWRHIKRFMPCDMSARCLDIGCGTGRWGLKLAKSGFTTDFLDISQKMLDQVGMKLEKLGNESSVLYHATIDDLSVIEKESYDFLIGQGDLLNCAENPRRALKELTRILKPGGVMVLSVDNKLGGIYHYFKNADVAGLKQFLKSGRTRWVTDKEEEQFEITMFSPDELRKMCASRGLEILSMIGKTVLPLRRFREMLEDKYARQELIRLEESLHSTEALLGEAAHIEVVVQKSES